MQTLDVWLGEQLTGEHVIAESQAWLLGLWNSAEQAWSPDAIKACGIDDAELPAVLTQPKSARGVCLPVLGDHEASVLCAMESVGSSIRLIECGTALAVMVGEVSNPSGLGIDSPQRCGYSETIDPWFYGRIKHQTVPAPDWADCPGQLSANDVVEAALTARVPVGERVVLCGGNASNQLRRFIQSLGYQAEIHPEITSSGGALLLAENEVFRDGPDRD